MPTCCQCGQILDKEKSAEEKLQDIIEIVEVCQRLIEPDPDHRALSAVLYFQALQPLRKFKEEYTT